MKDNKSEGIVRLKTPFEDNMGDIPYAVHPRQQFKRKGYLSLNGRWEFTVRKAGEIIFDGNITVPFPPESYISGLGRITDKSETLIYKRSFSIPEEFAGKRVLLHLDAVDQTCRVYVNSTFVGDYTCPYLPITADVTGYLRNGENTVTVEAEDSIDKDLPYGKQTVSCGGMWYTNVSGIWQSVWLEAIPQNYVKKMKLTPSIDRVIIETLGGEERKLLRINTPDGTEVKEFFGDQCELEISSPRVWSPEDPYLYYFTLECGEDTIESYFALRTFGKMKVGEREYLALNGKPYFLHGLLDQGYFSDGIYLPTTEKGYEKDILTMKACGFNMLRKHIKVEPDLFYYYCDKYGIIVCQDMVNNGRYSFLLDTALPTVGIKRGIRHIVGERQKEEFLRTSAGIIDHLYNHPSVCYYTIFNEGWGQFDADSVYEQLKKCDITRVYDTTSGWFHGKKSDVESEHVYFKPVKLRPKSIRPLVLSEFGGYSCRITGHVFNLRKNYGYRLCGNRSVFQRDLLNLYYNEIVPAIRSGLTCSVLTQLSDVEDETNGLFTYDRQVLKVDTNEMCKMSAKLFDVFEKNQSQAVHVVEEK